MKTTAKGRALIEQREGVRLKAINLIVADPRHRTNLERRFLPKVERRGADECWPWIAKAKTEYGYGRMTAGRKTHLKAHQIAWALANGPIPGGACILHRCDNPGCCNPSHYFLGSQDDNQRDMRSKGRGSAPPHETDDQHPNAKFDSAAADRIATDFRPAHVIAAELGVCTKTIYRHRKRIAWMSQRFHAEGCSP